MKLKFYKYQGTGNDFVIIDNRQNIFDGNNRKLIHDLCDRRFGIGADGLMLLENADAFDFKMVYFNADGSESTMCGNGGRCLVKFAFDIGAIKHETTFVAVDGPHHATVNGDWVSLKMIDVGKIVQHNYEDYFLNTGSPHVVKFVDGLTDYPVYEQGKTIRYSDTYAPKGTNVNFVELNAHEQLYVRTYERGVEDETYSCGTGVTAAAIVASTKGLKSPISITTKGGGLSVSFIKVGDGYEEVFLNGPAILVYSGEIEV